MLLSVALLCSCAESLRKYKDSEFTQLFNGKDLSGWYTKIRSGDEELAKKLFAVEDGMVHIFNDDFPDNYERNGDNATHGLFYTKREYSRYILRFEYKWGDKIANNYDMYQYDAGCYYHVVKDAIWPVGIEYQIRYNDIEDVNHTGDFVVLNQHNPNFKRSEDPDGRYLPESEGGEIRPYTSWLYRASADAPYNGLNGEWNECEIIVMGGKFAIHKLNGAVVNVGTDISFESGIIGLQAETAEVYYRNIRILEFKEDLPIEEFIQTK